MQNKIKNKAQQLTQNQELKKVLMSMKPEKTLWGILGIILFFILPEVITFIWGNDITKYAKEGLVLTTSVFDEQYYNMLVMLFGEGISWLNIIIGFVLLIWLFF
ncbi:MAG: hypothetical protein PHE73_03055 [Sulfurovaceae bacterium]|nr:hypothetical protein [Sulfurovaceae bacterium]